MDWAFVDRNLYQSSGKCRTRSDCTYVQSDLALHSPQNKPMFAEGRVKRTHRSKLDSSLRDYSP